jgi:hypothetical protein
LSVKDRAPWLIRRISRSLPVSNPFDHRTDRGAGRESAAGRRA